MRSEEFWKWFEDFAAPRLLARKDTFRKMFEHLDKFDHPVRIIETGCLEPEKHVDDNKWRGNGNSTLLFDKYAQTHPGSTVSSVDISQEHILHTRKNTSYATRLVCGDSVEVIKRWAILETKIDLLYLDASHLEWTDPIPSSLHHLNELMAAMPMLRADTMVAVDDSPAMMDDFPRAEVGGKGGLVATYAFSVGADLEFLHYQVGWTNMTNKVSVEEPSVEDLIYRARKHIEADRVTAADQLYRRVLDLTLTLDTPIRRLARGEACTYFAKLARAKMRFGMAADWYKEALNADPAAVEYRVDLATGCLWPINAIDSAIAEATRATKIAKVDEDKALAWHALGAMLHEKGGQGNLVKAFEAHQKELAFAQDASAALNCAAVALDLEKYDEVKELCLKAMGTDREPDAWHILAMEAYRNDRHEVAVEMFDKAIAGNCRDVGLAHWHKSGAMESIGMFPEAWREREGRADQVKRPQLAMPYRRFRDRPLWDGTPEPGKRIHVHAEAGAGDNLHLVRYLPQIAAMGMEVCYEAREDIRDLVRQSMPMVEVVDSALDFPGTLGLKDFDYHMPIGGLQRAFNATVKNGGWVGPYLEADPDKAVEYDVRMPKVGRRIGLCWSSGIILDQSAWLERYGRQKSMHYDRLHSIVVHHIHDTFVSLQVGPERSQRAAHCMLDLLPEKPNWTDTAALVANLDLVITVDTAVSHLAGAMGKPVWVMVPVGAGGSWHWMSARPGASWNERSPWYPSARIFRQKTPGDWFGVIEEVARALGEADVGMAGVAAE